MEGCEFSGKKDVMSGHEENECKFRKIKCKYSGKGCNVLANEDTITGHEDSCSFRNVSCKYSTEGCNIVAETDLVRIHENNCNYRKMKCKYSKDGCNFIGKKLFITQHEDDCSFRRLKCPQLGCEEVIPFRVMLVHIKLKHNVIIEDRWDNRRHSRRDGGEIFWRIEEDPSRTVTQFAIKRCMGYQFLPMCYFKNGIWMLWMVILGNETDAKKFGININVENNDASRPDKASLGMFFRGQIVSIFEETPQIKDNNECVLEFTNKMAKKMQERDSDGNLGIRVQYVISEKGPMNAVALGGGGSGPNMNSPGRANGSELVNDMNNAASSKPIEITTILIVRGIIGFGFTIVDSEFGPKVNRIMDHPRCKNLQKGDILISINGVSVRSMTHEEVAQVLKDCPVRQEASIKIERGLPPAVGGGDSPWKCNKCTYENSSSTFQDYCEVCLNPRVFASPHADPSSSSVSSPSSSSPPQRNCNQQ